MVSIFNPFKISDSILPSVNSADVTAWAMCLLEEEPRELYVEIRLEELVMHAADATRGCEPWNEEFLM
jgi:hypothetical protein